MIRRKLAELEDKFDSKPIVVVTEKVTKYRNHNTGRWFRYICKVVSLSLSSFNLFLVKNQVFLVSFLKAYALDTQFFCSFSISR